MRNPLKTAALVLALTTSASHGEELAPDALVKTISLDVLAAILLLPGALIGAPILWWLGHRRKTQPQPTWKACS